MGHGSKRYIYIDMNIFHIFIHPKLINLGSSIWPIRLGSAQRAGVSIHRLYMSLQIVKVWESDALQVMAISVLR